MRPTGLFHSATLSQPVILTSDLQEAPVADEIDRAIASVASRKNELLDGPAMHSLLRDAREQMDRFAMKPVLKGTFPDELQLSLVLSAIRSKSRPPRPRQIRTLDLVGTSQYEELDPGWLGSLYNRLTVHRVPFPTHVQRNVKPTVSVGDQVTIGIAGDWGTGNISSQNIGQHIRALQPHHTIHLGDVYYSGTEDEEHDNFLNLWPTGTVASAPSFALNANHDMYSGGEGYFNDVLTHSSYEAQQGLSYFALVNNHWAIVGLDSAYFADDCLYQEGKIDRVQSAWMQEVIVDARRSGKRIILLTHHDGIDIGPDASELTKQPLWNQIIQALDGGPDYWYWGHVHAGIAYAPIATGRERLVRARCVGHGGVPYAPFPSETSSVGDVEVQWVETRKAGDPDEDRRALSGFVLITLDGNNIKEQFIDENGTVRKAI